MVGARKESSSKLQSIIASAINKNIIANKKNISKCSKKFKKDQIMCVVCVCSNFRGNNFRTTRTTMGNMNML